MGSDPNRDANAGLVGDFEDAHGEFARPANLANA
ncbi:MAG: hypothetical protein ACI8RC_003419, partial [Ilumatobacter sp.]